MAAEETLYCLCRRPYEEDQFMIECDVCKDWFHGSCVGIQEHQASEIETYHCPDCQITVGPLVLKKKKNWRNRSRSDSDGNSNKIQTGSPAFIQELKARTFPGAEEIPLVRLRGHEVSMEYFDEAGGLELPILVDRKDGLDLKVPPPSFSIQDVENQVGSMREIDVIDVARQEDYKMLMREWTEYYNSPNRDKILNVISLEFSNTKLAELVQPPRIVRELSWVSTLWPPEHSADDSMFVKPEVQRYCLMGVKDSFTDFHVDFGGTSVWYHVLRGEKIFYMIRPTASNLTLYERWLSSSNQNAMFFGDQVDVCYKMVVKQGQTVFLPSGWIHAVLTPIDSLVFGGNFLHMYNIDMQINVYEIEKRVQTADKYMFPNYETLHWYAAKTVCDRLRDYNEDKRKVPTYLIKGAKALAHALKMWTHKKEYIRKENIPETIQYGRLLKDLNKEIKHMRGTSPVKGERSSPKKEKVKPEKPGKKSSKGKSDKSPKKSKVNTDEPFKMDRRELLTKAEKKRKKEKKKDGKPREEEGDVLDIMTVDEESNKVEPFIRGGHSLPVQPISSSLSSPDKLAQAKVRQGQGIKLKLTGFEFPGGGANLSPAAQSGFLSSNRQDSQPSGQHQPQDKVSDGLKMKLKVKGLDVGLLSVLHAGHHESHAHERDMVFDVAKNVDEPVDDRVTLDDQKGHNDSVDELEAGMDAEEQKKPIKPDSSPLASTNQPIKQSVYDFTDSENEDVEQTSATPLQPAHVKAEHSDSLEWENSMKPLSGGQISPGRYQPPLPQTWPKAEPRKYDDDDDDDVDSDSLSVDESPSKKRRVGDSNTSSTTIKPGSLRLKLSMAKGQPEQEVSSGASELPSGLEQHNYAQRASMPTIRGGLNGSIADILEASGYGTETDFKIDEESALQASPTMRDAIGGLLSMSCMGGSSAPMPSTLTTTPSTLLTTAERAKLATSSASLHHPGPESPGRKKHPHLTYQKDAGDRMPTCYKDEDYVYPTLDDSDLEDKHVFKPRGRQKKEQTWYPKAKLKPNPKMERPPREGARRESVESGLAAAAAKLADKPRPKRSYIKKKTHGERRSSILDTEPTPGTSYGYDLDSPSESRGGSSHGKDTPNSPGKNKRPKKGMATAKQRLSKILKIHKMVF